MADLFGHRLIAKGGNKGCWSGCYGRSAAENMADRLASTASSIGPGVGWTTDCGIVGPHIPIGLHSFPNVLPRCGLDI